MARRPASMQHIDREELFTSLPARIEYLHSFLEFGPDDVEALVDGQKYVKMVIPAIVNMVYKKLLQSDVTARVFSTRDSRREEDPDQWVSEEGRQIQHRKMFLRWYLTKLNSDPSKMEYWEYLDKVGYMHVGQGRRNPLFVDYIFLGACLGYIQDAVFEAILSHPRLSLERKIPIVKAIGKVIWIQNDLLARWHLKDGSEFSAEMDNDPESFRQPTSLSQQVIDDLSQGLDGTSIASSGSGKTSLGRTPEEVKESQEGSRCPFSGMASGPGTDLGRQRASAPSSIRSSSDELSRPSTGVPRLHVVHGEVIGKEKLHLSLLDDQMPKHYPK